jgi:O-antigen/teichoic acid export membrane protein
MSSRHIVDKSLTNILWSYLSFFSTKALNLIAIIVIALYVSPAEFGLMAFSLVVLGYFELLQGFGLGAFLISTQEDVEEAAHAVFAFAVSASAAIFAVLWLSADTVAGFVGQPELAEILRVLSIFLLIESVAQVHNSLLQRELKFRLKILPEVGRGLVKGFLSIGLAMAGFGVWSLVWGHIAGTLAWTVILMVVKPWWPRKLPRRALLGAAIRFGSNIVVGELVNSIPRTLDQFLIGKILGPAPLGLYALAQRMPQLALKTFGMEAIKVIHPIMSQMQPDPLALRVYYYGLVRYFALLIIPAGVMLAAVTESLIHILYTPEWRAMIPAMQLLSLAFALGFLNLLPGMVYKAINRSDLFLYIALINLPFAVIAFWIATPFGIEAVAAAQIALVFVLYTPNFIMLRRAIGVEAAATARAVVPGLACAVAAATGALLARQIAPDPGSIQLLSMAAGALAAYMLAVWRLGPEIFSEARRIIINKVFKKRHPDA